MSSSQCGLGQLAIYSTSGWQWSWGLSKDCWVLVLVFLNKRRVRLLPPQPISIKTSLELSLPIMDVPNATLSYLFWSEAFKWRRSSIWVLKTTAVAILRLIEVVCCQSGEEMATITLEVHKTSKPGLVSYLHQHHTALPVQERNWSVGEDLCLQQQKCNRKSFCVD